MKKFVWVIVGLGLMIVSSLCYGALRWDTGIDGLTVGINKGVAITYYDIKNTELKGGYSVPLVLYEVPDSVLLIKDYNGSLDVGVVGDDKDVDALVGLGTNAPYTVASYIVKKLVNKDLPYKDKIKVGLVGIADINRLINEGEISGSYGLELGIKASLDW